MGKKLIISESQYSRLKDYIYENNFHQILVGKLITDLNTNYEPMYGIMRDGGEYFQEPMIKVKVDGNEITVKDLYEYFKKKYKLGDEFIKQVISDWMFDNIKDNTLSKNVAIN